MWHNIGEMVVDMRLSSRVGIGSSKQDLAGSLDGSYKVVIYFVNMHQTLFDISCLQHLITDTQTDRQTDRHNRVDNQPQSDG